MENCNPQCVVLIEVQEYNDLFTHSDIMQLRLKSFWLSVIISEHQKQSKTPKWLFLLLMPYDVLKWLSQLLLLSGIFHHLNQPDRTLQGWDKSISKNSDSKYLWWAFRRGWKSTASWFESFSLPNEMMRLLTAVHSLDVVLMMLMLAEEFSLTASSWFHHLMRLTTLNNWHSVKEYLESVTAATARS